MRQMILKTGLLALLLLCGPIADAGTSLPDTFRTSHGSGVPAGAPFTVNHACTFDGVDEQLQAGTTLTLTDADQMTVIIWTRITTAGATSEYWISKYDATPKDGWGIGYNDGAGLGVLVLLPGSLSGPTGRVEFNTTLATDTVQQLVLAIDASLSGTAKVRLWTAAGTDTTLVEDTTKTTAGTMSTTIETTTEPLSLAALDGGNYFDDRIIEIAIIDAYMTDNDEIQATRNGDQPADLSEHDQAANIIGWWRCGDTVGDSMDSGSGGQILDASGQDNNAAAINTETGDLITFTYD